MVSLPQQIIVNVSVAVKKLSPLTDKVVFHPVVNTRAYKTNNACVPTVSLRTKIPVSVIAKVLFLSMVNNASSRAVIIR